VHHADFVAGTLASGVSLNEMMDVLKSDAFTSTQRNVAKKEGNTDPRHAYLQQPAVELSLQGFEWLKEKLELAFAEHGMLTPTELEQLDRPDE
jgi:hypothetical protein